MRLTKFKKTVFSVGLGVSLVSGAMVALAETPQVITRVSADAQHSQVIEDGNTTYIIQAPGQRAPSPIVTPGVTTSIKCNFFKCNFIECIKIQKFIRWFRFRLFKRRR